MKRFLHRLAARLEKHGRLGSFGLATRRFRPALESLEARDVLSTLFLVPASTPADASHFHSFQSAYQAAHSGDVIQIEPGATVSSVGQGVVGHWLSGGTVNTDTITIDNPNIGAGEWVEVNGGGGSAENYLFVLSAQPTGQGGVTLTLNQTLAMPHDGGGATVTTLGQLGVAKAITLQGDPSDPQAVVASPLEAPTSTSNVVFNNLDFTSPQGLVLDAGHQNITVENSTVSFLQMSIGAGNANDVITGNTFTGGAVLNGDGGGLTADRVTNNRFIDNSSLYLINNGDSLVSGNTFNDSANQDPFVAITVVNCLSILLYNNSVTVSNADASTTGLFLWDSSFYRQSLTAFVENNVFNTGGKGVGLDTSGAVNAKVEGNDFRQNAVGVYLWGDGNTAGNVDLGGGSFGSQGQNNFSSFTAAGTGKGLFAITMHNTSANDQVYAYSNLWSASVPPNVVKDGYANTNANEAVYSGFAPGTGGILTVDIQMFSRVPLRSPSPPPPAPNPFDEAAKDALFAVQGLRSGNTGAVYASLMDFESLLARAAGSQQQAVELAFLQDICADL
jgi:hypothetical protein